MSPAIKYEWTGTDEREHWIEIGEYSPTKLFADGMDEAADQNILADEVLRLAARVKELEAELKEKEGAEWDRHLEGKEERPD
jgi:hypothetical protein